MSNRKGSAPITECPVCHEPMRQGTRISATFNWEGANIIKRRYNFTEHEWHESEEIGPKGKTMTVCRKCGEKAASILGIGRPEEVLS